MSVVYKDPKDNLKYCKWNDYFGNSEEVWYERNKVIYLTGEYEKTNLPDQLIKFLKKWTKKIKENLKTFKEEYPVKDARIEFIYENECYRLEPKGVGAVSDTPHYYFFGDEYFPEYHSLFEKYEAEIREDLENTLGVKYSRYLGYLD